MDQLAGYEEQIDRLQRELDTLQQVVTAMIGTHPSPAGLASALEVQRELFEIGAADTLSGDDPEAPIEERLDALAQRLRS